MPRPGPSPLKRRVTFTLAGVVGAFGLLLLVAWWIDTADDRFLRSISVRLVSFAPCKPPAGDTFGCIPRRGDSRGDTVEFEICNRSARTLSSVTFSPRTYHAGRSTPRSIVANSDHGFLASFHSDLIVSPSECGRMTWVGTYELLDSLEVLVLGARPAP